MPKMRCPASALTIPRWARSISVFILKCGDPSPIRKPLPRLFKPCSASPWNPIPKPPPRTPRSTLLRPLLNACHACGHHNREGNKFCGMCGLPLGAAPSQSPDPTSSVHRLTRFRPTRTCRNLHDERMKAVMRFIPQPGAPASTHHYHHHYHHHYFQGGAQAPSSVRVPTPPRAREKPTA